MCKTRSTAIGYRLNTALASLHQLVTGGKPPHIPCVWIAAHVEGLFPWQVCCQCTSLTDAEYSAQQISTPGPGCLLALALLQRSHSIMQFCIQSACAANAGSANDVGHSESLHEHLKQLCAGWECINTAPGIVSNSEQHLLCSRKRVVRSCHNCVGTALRSCNTQLVTGASPVAM